MINENNNISLFQLALILTHAQIGVGMITLAVDVHNYAKADSWISILLAGLLIQCVILIFGFMIKRFPNDNFFEVMEIIFGKWIGKLFISIYCFYYIMIGALLFAKYTVILKSWMMPLTPQWILVAFIALVGISATKENLQVISRFFILSSVVILVFLGFVIYALKDANYTYILPVGQAGIKSILTGAVSSSLSYQGYEYLLFIAPFVLAKRNQVIKTATLTNVFITAFYMFVVLTTHLFFSSEEMKLLTEPVFYLVKSFSFKVIERPDLLFTSLWLVLVVTSVVTLFYITSLGFVSLFQSKRRTPYVYIATLTSFIISNILYGENKIDFISKHIAKLTLFLTIVTPIIFLFISYVLRKKGAT